MASIQPGPAFKAGGTIAPSRIVKLSTAADYAVLQCTAVTDVCIGVSQEGMKRTPGMIGSDTTIAAEADDPVQVVTYGVALVEAGGAVTRGDPVKTDTSGRGVTASGVGQHNLIGRALESASGAGVFFRVLVNPEQITL